MANQDPPPDKEKAPAPIAVGSESIFMLVKRVEDNIRSRDLQPRFDTLTPREKRAYESWFGLMADLKGALSGLVSWSMTNGGPADLSHALIDALDVLEGDIDLEDSHDRSVDYNEVAI